MMFKNYIKKMNLDEIRSNYKINYNIETPILNNFIIIQISDKVYFENEFSANRIERGWNSENKTFDFELR